MLEALHDVGRFILTYTPLFALLASLGTQGAACYRHVHTYGVACSVGVGIHNLFVVYDGGSRCGYLKGERTDQLRANFFPSERPIWNARPETVGPSACLVRSNPGTAFPTLVPG